MNFRYGVKVTNVLFDIHDGKKQAKTIVLESESGEEKISLTENDLVFYTNGSNVENSTYGSQTKAAGMDGEIHPGGSFDLWRKIATQDPSFGRPEKFCMDPEDSNWVSATVNTLDEKILPYIRRICKRDPLSGGVVTGGIVTVRDSSWLLSWTINRQPQYRSQPEGQVLVWLYGMFSDRPGDYVKKPMRDCTGAEICEEWLYHLGVPEVWGSVYDLRDLLDATVALRDGKKLTDMELGFKERVALKETLKKVSGTEVEKLLKEHGMI